jgi:hypothetical protein
MDDSKNTRSLQSEVRQQSYSSITTSEKLTSKEAIEEAIERLCPGKMFCLLSDLEQRKVLETALAIHTIAPYKARNV